MQASNEKNRQLLQFRHNLMQTVSHEMRTALTAISGNAELLLRDEALEDRVRHILTVRESASRMASMTTELLEFSGWRSIKKSCISVHSAPSQ